MRATGPVGSQAEAESAFARGWTELGAGNFAAAAEAFAHAAGPRGENTLSEDACFWRAVAFDRAGRFGEAQRAFTEFLARYPRSDRAGEASVMLGWLLLRAGDGAAAAARFAGALDDPGERVRGSAQAGLAAAASPRHD
jgi:TolA-binding protein